MELVKSSRDKRYSNFIVWNTSITLVSCQAKYCHAGSLASLSWMLLDYDFVQNPTQSNRQLCNIKHKNRKTIGK